MNPELDFTYNEFTKRNIGFVSADEQAGLRAASVLMIGVGGMGGVALQCLARTGIGRFIFCDIDTFEVSNLNRQIFSNLESLGKDKAEITRAEILKINPECRVDLLNQNWLDQLDEILPQVTVVINGCDDARASIQLLRKAKEHGKTVIDAFASPLPSVYVVRPQDPRPEETFKYPTVGKSYSEMTEEDAKVCAAREIEFVLSQSSSADHVILDIAAEMISGKRKRISFAPMVWSTGVMMSYEAIRIILQKPGGPGPLGVFMNPWNQRFERASRGPLAKLKLIFVRRFLAKMATASVCIPLLLLSGCLEAESTSFKSYRSQTAAADQTPSAHFLMGDFGGIDSNTLQTNALPWKLTTTYMLLRESRRTGQNLGARDIPRLLQKYGFITPRAIVNWPAGLPQPSFDGPVGLIRGTGELSGNPGLPVATLEMSNLNCASCHGGTAYDSSGRPTLNVWLGAPNSSLNLEAYTQDAYLALGEAALATKSDATAQVRQIYPNITASEVETIRIAFGTVRKRVAQIQKTTNHATPYSNGSSGLTNAVAALKRGLKVIDLNQWHGEETALTAIPNLGDRYLRTSLLYSGAYSLKNDSSSHDMLKSQTPRTKFLDFTAVLGFFTIPVMGQTPEQAEKHLPKAQWAARFVMDYKTPPFPGPINWTQAERGRMLFETNCQHCHGTYSGPIQHLELTEFPNKVIPTASIGTDPQVANLIDARLVAAIANSRMGRYMNAEVSKGYVPPILTGVWNRAPYLHNGSVPTLWHLMNPEIRPQSFEVGGHRLDFQMMGIAGQMNEYGLYGLARDFKPWAQPSLYRTTELGRSNRGHERQFAGLNKNEKMDLIEFLKAL